MRIEPLLGEPNCLILRGVRDRTAVLTRIASAAAGVLGGTSEAEILAGLEARERATPTSTPEGVAFPHTLVPDRTEIALIVAVVDPPVPWIESEPSPTSLVLCLVGSADQPFAHVRLLARLARVVRAESARSRLIASPDAASLLARMIEEDRSHG
jgi:mannitol/fructose-specific phosphotransferase system IIA component (Ntr-type)